MSDEDIRHLERNLGSASEADVERYLTEKIRRSPDLVRKLVRRMIRLERVVIMARVNEEHYYAPVTTKEFLGFLDTDAPDRSRRAGHLSIEGEWPESGAGSRGGRVTLQGGSCSGVEGPAIHIDPTNAELHAMILELTRRIEVLEHDP